ncbi:hypothetical protein TetV_068 [Tetraselmis virus 1]|uniref:Uncharacterized protein n=1 Tax=Tetraselmis virus 1 TaxID=2060617 RepID=A0A2P0VMQ9_9VIRU|nr:hypothetical protein QJ968_gp068 [Tetraselmis virus 1]AUF82160.1 hypothetical protein TetV_068 [Tetraselmis virus 1]
MSCSSKNQTKELAGGLAFSGIVGVFFGTVVYLAEKFHPGKKWIQPLLNVIASLISYFLDIVFAKVCFQIFSSGKVEIYSFTKEGLIKRFLWFIRSIPTFNFFRYVIIAILDAIVVRKLTTRIEKLADNHNVMTSHKPIRNTIVTVFISFLTFNLYVNILRFQWAYVESTDNLIITILLMLWLSFMLFGAKE